MTAKQRFKRAADLALEFLTNREVDVLAWRIELQLTSARSKPRAASENAPNRAQLPGNPFRHPEEPLMPRERFEVASDLAQDWLTDSELDLLSWRIEQMVGRRARNVPDETPQVNPGE